MDLGSTRLRIHVLPAPPNELEMTDIERHVRVPGRRTISVGGVSTWILIMNGYHVFCAAPLYSTPYALMESGWFGIFLLVLYWLCAFCSSLALGTCMASFPALYPDYQEVGVLAYGRKGRTIVLVNEQLVVLAGCVESVTIVCQAVVYGWPEFIAILNDQSKWTIVAGVIVLIIPVTVICEKLNVERFDLYLTVVGTILNILVVACLVWLRYINGVTENTSTTEYIKLSGLPTASGLFGYCFAGHPYLPILYRSITTNGYRVISYRNIIFCIFVPSLLTYGYAAILGYSMFGANIKSVYILNMPLEYHASVVAVIAMVVHQFIRFFMGVHALEDSVYNGLRRRRRGSHHNHIRIILKGAVVAVIVPLSILVPAYGPLMAFLGSFLGIFVSLILPCVCTLKLRRRFLSTGEVFFLSMIILLAAVAAIAGMVSSYPQMKEMQWVFVKFG